MEVGDLVRARVGEHNPFPEDWTGIIVDWRGTEPIVYWNEEFPSELEYKEQIEVVS
jgi:hypothetical protein